MSLPERILLTTSRNPTPRIRTFCHDFARMMPNTVYVNRGKMGKDEVAEKALEHNADRVLVVDRGGQGGLGVLRFFRIGEAGLVSTSPVINVADMKLQRDFPFSKVKPAASIRAIGLGSSNDMLKLVSVFSGFFGVSMLKAKDVAEAESTILSVSLDKSRRIVMTFMVEPHHSEVGPRIVISEVE